VHMAALSGGVRILYKPIDPRALEQVIATI
jgi:hypothetical protein